MCVYVCTVCMCSIWVYEYVCINDVYMCMCMCIYVCMYQWCIHVYVYVYVCVVYDVSVWRVGCACMMYQYMSMHVWVHVYVCMYGSMMYVVCECIWLYVSMILLCCVVLLYVHQWYRLYCISYQWYVLVTWLLYVYQCNVISYMYYI